MRNDAKIQELINKLRNYLEDKDIKFAYLCGSYSRGNFSKLSDIDIGIFFEKTPSFKERINILVDIEQLIKREIDLIVLNVAPPTLVFSCINYGIPILMKDEKFFIDWWLEVSSEALDFFEFIEDFQRLKTYGGTE